MIHRYAVAALAALSATGVLLGGGWAAEALLLTPRPRPMGYAVPGVTPAADMKVEAALTLEERMAEADPAEGAALFRACAACHTATPGGGNGVGPNLYGVMGAPVGQGRGGYPFSAALRDKGGRWDFATMDRWLADPAAFAPGTRMTFAGMENPQDRAALIVWLNSRGGRAPGPPPAGNAANRAAEELTGAGAGSIGRRK